jgi:hypothetical protein
MRHEILEFFLAESNEMVLFMPYYIVLLTLLAIFKSAKLLANNITICKLHLYAATCNGVLPLYINTCHYIKLIIEYKI